VTPFTDVHLKQLKTEGYCIVEKWLDDDLLDRAQRDLLTVVPTWEQHRLPFVKAPMWLDFPYQNDAANDIALHPDLIAFAEKVLETTEIVLAHSEMLIKYAGAYNMDQTMHMDWGNNSLVVPPQDGFDQLASITYYSDVTLDLGPTKFVGWSDADSYLHQREWRKDEAPELYAKEQSAVVPAGSILLYGMRSFHRGSAMIATEGTRHSQHVAYKRAGDQWTGWGGHPRHAGQPKMDALLTRLTPRQREMIGFPAPGDAYWTEFTLDGVARRYPEMDMTPYRNAISSDSAS
jgi:hypothetical protein